MNTRIHDNPDNCPNPNLVRAWIGGMGYRNVLCCPGHEETQRYNAEVVGPFHHANVEECPQRVPVRVQHGAHPYAYEQICPGHQPPDMRQQVTGVLPGEQWFREQLDLMRGEGSFATAQHIWGNLVMMLQEKLTEGGAR